MKRIGIIGGMAPDSTQLYYKYIIDEYRRRFNDHSYPEIIIYSVNFQRFVNWMASRDWRSIADELVNVASKLYNAGADFALIATNTMHIVFKEVSRRSPIPLLSIVKAVGEEAAKNDIKVVGLLGTRFTMTENFYKDGLGKYGIKVVVPNDEEIQYIDHVIFRELTRGIIREESRGKFVEIIYELKEKGAEAIILGCTEIPLLVKQEDVDIKLLDSTKIHAIKALEYALE